MQGRQAVITMKKQLFLYLPGLQWKKMELLACSKWKSGKSVVSQLPHNSALCLESAPHWALPDIILTSPAQGFKRVYYEQPWDHWYSRTILWRNHRNRSQFPPSYKAEPKSLNSAPQTWQKMQTALGWESHKPVPLPAQPGGRLHHFGSPFSHL